MRYQYPTPDDSKNNMGNINMEETREDGFDGETECYLSKIEKLAVPARLALLQSSNIWVGNLGAFIHCKNNRCGGSNTHEGSGAGTMGAHGEYLEAL